MAAGRTPPTWAIAAGAALAGAALGIATTASCDDGGRGVRDGRPATTTLDRCALAEALAPIEEEVRRLAEQQLPVAAVRTPETGESTAPPEWLEEAIARIEEAVARLDALERGAPMTPPIEEQLRRVQHRKDATAIARLFDELDRDDDDHPRERLASYALLGPVAIAERFGAPDSFDGDHGKTWWWWRLDDERSLGIAFANGLVCDFGTD